MDHRFLFVARYRSIWSFDLLWPSNAIWRYRSRSTLAQVIACCLVPSHYLNQCCHTINKIMWHSPKTDISWSSRDIRFVKWVSKIHLWNNFHIIQGPVSYVDRAKITQVLPSIISSTLVTYYDRIRSLIPSMLAWYPSFDGQCFIELWFHGKFFQEEAHLMSGSAD